VLLYASVAAAKPMLKAKRWVRDPAVAQYRCGGLLADASIREMWLTRGKATDE
jgi:hypothetical protein